MVELVNVSKSYGKGPLALDDVSLTVEDGEFVFIVGSSGAGKSTLLKLLLREEEPTGGKVLVDGIDLGRLTRRRIPYFRRSIGVVFQDFRLIPQMNVFENVAFALRVWGCSPGPGASPSSFQAANSSGSPSRGRLSTTPR